MGERFHVAYFATNEAIWGTFGPALAGTQGRPLAVPRDAATSHRRQPAAIGSRSISNQAPLVGRPRGTADWGIRDEWQRGGRPQTRRQSTVPYERRLSGMPARRKPRVHHMPPGPNRWKDRSRTYEGIALAMAEQWGSDLTHNV